jgi:hypothetical protein
MNSDLKDVPIFISDYSIKCNEDGDLVNKLIESYKFSCRDGKFDISDQWRNNINSNASELIKGLDNSDVKFCLEYLSKLFISTGLRGISMSDEFLTRKSDLYVNHTIAHTIVSLAEYLDSVPTECIEIGEIKKYNVKELEELLNKISENLEVKVSFPEIFGAYGLRLGSYFVTVDMFEHIYALKRSIDGYINYSGSLPRKIIEIGGGFGDACYWSQKFLKPDKYTIIDLPYTLVLQGWFLSKTCGTNSVKLYSKDYEFNESKIINLVPPFVIQRLQSNSFDHAWNQNSFPEMSYSIVTDYTNSLKRLIKPKGKLYSYNQATQVRVSKLIKSCPSFKLISRSPSWTRSGYVEELYERI